MTNIQISFLLTHHNLVISPRIIYWLYYWNYDGFCSFPFFRYVNCIANFLCPKPHQFKTGLSMYYRQLYQETLEYSCNRKAFSIHLREKFTLSDGRFYARCFSLIGVLHFEPHTFFPESSSGSAADYKDMITYRSRLKKLFRNPLLHMRRVFGSRSEDSDSSRSYNPSSHTSKS